MPKRTFDGTVGDSGTGSLRIPAECGGFKTLPKGEPVELTNAEAAHVDGLKDARIIKPTPDPRLVGGRSLRPMPQDTKKSKDEGGDKKWQE